MSKNDWHASLITCVQLYRTPIKVWCSNTIVYIPSTPMGNGRQKQENPQNLEIQAEWKKKIPVLKESKIVRETWPLSTHNCVQPYTQTWERIKTLKIHLLSAKNEKNDFIFWSHGFTVHSQLTWNSQKSNCLYLSQVMGLKVSTTTLPRKNFKQK